MKKNVASQVIGAQMVTAADGTAFTGTVSVVVTVDNGTQSASGGTGPTHKGNGYHSYSPTQAETNGDHIAFTFTGTGAVPVTVQVYTTFPQTGDSFARLGAPAGASVSADIATVDGVVDAILLDTGTDGVVVAAGSKTGYTISGTITTLDALDTAQDSQHATTQSAISALNDPTAAAIADAVWDELQSAHVGAGTFGEVATEVAGIKTVTDVLPDSGALSSLATAAALATAQTDLDVLTGADGVTLATLQPNYAPATSAAVAALNDLSAAEVNAEVVDALATDTYAEPGQGAPAATTSLAAKINYVYKAWRNKTEQTATTLSLYDDAGTTVDQKATVSDDGTTATKGEIGTGP